MPLCVLLLVPTWPPEVGGLGRAARRLAQGLVAQGASVLAIVPEAGAPLEGAPPEGLGLQVWGRPRAREGGPALDGAALAQARAWWATRAGGHQGVVQAVYPSRTGRAGLDLAQALGLPFVASLRGNDLDRDAQHPTRGAVLREALVGCQLAVGVSHAHAAGALTLGAPRAIAIPNGVDAALWASSPRRPEVALALGLRPGEGPVLAFAGEGRAKKGFATMLDAFALVAAQVPGASLLLAGGLRPEAQDELGHWAAVHPACAARVRVLPWLEGEDLRAVLAWADLAWHPSLADGLPSAALEAMALGLPLLASPVGGLADLLHGSPLAPWAVPPGDAQALALASLRLWAAPALRARLGAQGRVWVARRFAQEAEPMAYLRAYADLSI